jgi:riboflavin kinase / FMN adenylyltransferase
MYRALIPLDPTKGHGHFLAAMKIYESFDALPEEARGSAVAIGNFDGVHPGHQAVIGEAGRIAKTAGIPWSVMTFEPHPRGVFWPDTGPFRLTPRHMKARHVESLGVDFMVVQRFDQAFLQLPAETFVRTVLVDALRARHVVAGYDFVFGHERGGTCELLLRMGKEIGFGFTSVTAVRDGDGTTHSSTRVRECLKNADPRGAARALGRPFEIEAVVERGDMRGRKMGFPTANQDLGEYLRPAKGVYAVRAGIADGAKTVWHDGVANLGHRPTFAGKDLILETHLFDFEGDLYGQTLRVALIGFLRPEKKFDGLDALQAQIADDCARARRILAQNL